MQLNDYCEKHKPAAPLRQKFMDRVLTPLLSRIFWIFQLKQEPFPGILSLEVTSICNLKCPMCPRTFSDRKFSHMSLPLYKKLIDEIAVHDAEKRVEQVALQGYGEIFLHPQWFEIVEYASRKIKNAYIRLDTNGTLMKEPIVEKLFECHLKALTVSVDGIDPETYSFLRTGGKYDDLVANVRSFIAARKKSPDRGPELFLQIIESDYTRPYLERYRAFWTQEIGDAVRIHVSVIPFHDFAGQIENEKFESRDKQRLFVNLPCYRMTYEVEIFSDGVTSFCCLDSERQLLIGSVQDRSIADLWHDPDAARLRAEMRKGDYRNLVLCRTCPVSQKFMGKYTSWRSAGEAFRKLGGMFKRYSGRRFFYRA